MNGDNIDPVSPGEEAGARAMFELAEDARGEISEEVPDLQPVLWGGADASGWSQISVRVPPGSPVDARRLWIDLAEVVAQHCEKVGIPVEGGNARMFRAILEERLEDPSAGT